MYKNFHMLLPQSSLNSLPINYIPNSIKIFCLAILILQIVRMLPSINAEKWFELSDDRVLILQHLTLAK